MYESLYACVYISLLCDSSNPVAVIMIPFFNLFAMNHIEHLHSLDVGLNSLIS